MNKDYNVFQLVYTNYNYNYEDLFNIVQFLSAQIAF